MNTTLTSLLLRSQPQPTTSLAENGAVSFTLCPLRHALPSLCNANDQSSAPTQKRHRSRTKGQSHSDDILMSRSQCCPKHYGTNQQTKPTHAITTQTREQSGALFVVLMQREPRRDDAVWRDGRDGGLEVRDLARMRRRLHATRQENIWLVIATTRGSKNQKMTREKQRMDYGNKEKNRRCVKWTETKVRRGSHHSDNSN